MREAEARERKRLMEIKMREEKIQKMMDSMADVDTNQGAALERKQEKEYIQQCIHKDELASQQDILKKQQQKRQHLQLKSFLDQQVNIKKQQMYEEKVQNHDFMASWVKKANAEILISDENKRNLKS